MKATGLWGHLEWGLDEAIVSLSKTTEEEQLTQRYLPCGEREEEVLIVGTVNTDGEQDKRSHRSEKEGQGSHACHAGLAWDQSGSRKPPSVSIGPDPGKDPISQPPSVATWLSSNQ